MVVRAEVDLHESGFGVGCKSLLLDLGIEDAKVVIKVDFCLDSLSEVVIGHRSWSLEGDCWRWSLEFIIRGGCRSLKPIVRVGLVKVVVEVGYRSVTMVITNGG